MNQRHHLSIAVATIIASLAGQNALAASKQVTVGGTSPIVVANENPTSTSISKFALGANTNRIVIDVPIPSLPSALYSVNQSDRYYYVKLALTNGAKFAGVTVMKCQTSTDTKFQAANLQVGAATEKVTFQLLSAATTVKIKARSVSGCLVSASSITLSSGLKPIQVSAVVEFVSGLSDVRKVPYKSDLITFNNSLRPVYSLTGAKVTVDVGAESKSFITVATRTTKTTALLGRIVYDTASITALHFSTGKNVTAGQAVTDVTITIAGAPLAAVATTKTGGVYLSKTALCSAGGNLLAAVKGTTGASNSVSFTVDAATIVPSLKGNKGVYVCISNKGKNSVDKGTITASLKGTANGLFRPIFGNEGSLVEVTKNGASTKVLNIPAVSNSDDAFIRINNMSTQSGKVFGTLYGQDGAILGTPNALIGSIGSLQTLVLRPEQYPTIFSISEWTGRAWMQLDTEVSSISVQNLIRTPDGTLVNMSEGVKKSN